MKKIILIFCLLLLVQVVNSQCVRTLAGVDNPDDINGSVNLARFFYPEGIAVDGSGNVYVVDSGNFKIKK